MASIMGFTMKGIKKPLGREGYGCIGTMYLDGTKIGTYKDYGDGACEIIEYTCREHREAMMKVVIAYAKEHHDKFIANLYKQRPQQFQEEIERFKKFNPFIPDEDITIETMSANSEVFIVDALLNLIDLEKSFKKYQKEGYRAMSVKGYEITAYPQSWTDEQIKKMAAGAELFFSLQDFVK